MSNDFDLNQNRLSIFLHGKNLIENGDILNGIRYLEISIDRKCVDAVNYYCRLLIKGNLLDKDIQFAKTCLKKFIKTNNDTVLLLYGKILKKEQKFSEACQYFRKSSKLGNSEAMYELGKLLLNGKTIQQDVNQAIKLFTLSQKKGYNKSAKFLLKPTKSESKKRKTNIFKSTLIVSLIICSVFLLYKFKQSQSKNYIVINDKIKGVSDDQDQTNLYLKQSADDGNCDAMFNYAIHILEGKGIDADPKEAGYYFKKAADCGLSDAMCNYGVMLLQGYGAEVDKKEGERYIKMAADNGFPLAMHFYAQIKEHEDAEESVKYYEKAIKKGSVQSMYRLGLLLYEGKGIKQNIKKANNYFKKAADKGDLGAIITYGFNLLQGMGVKQNFKDGLKYIKKASEIALIESLYGLSQETHLPQSHVELNGNGMNEHERDRLVYFLKTLADNDILDAIYIYGSALLLGHGTQKNTSEAAKYFKKGSNLGDIDSLFSFAMMLYANKDFPMNTEESFRLIKKASDSGHKKAKIMYSLMKKNIDDVEFNLKELVKYST